MSLCFPTPALAKLKNPSCQVAEKTPAVHAPTRAPGWERRSRNSDPWPAGSWNCRGEVVRRSRWHLQLHHLQSITRNIDTPLQTKIGGCVPNCPKKVLQQLGSRHDWICLMIDMIPGLSISKWVLRRYIPMKGGWPLANARMSPTIKQEMDDDERNHLHHGKYFQSTHTHPWISLQDASIMCHSARVQAKGRSLAAFAGTLGPQFGFEHGLPPILKGVNYLVCPLRLISIANLCHLRVYLFLHKPTASFSPQPQATPANSTPLHPLMSRF